MKKLFFLILISVSAIADHNISVFVDGHEYDCSGTGGGSSDPNCVPTLGDYCDKHTTLSGSECYKKVTDACQGKGVKFSSCVTATADYCDDHTTMSGVECFESALGSCRGDKTAIFKLMDGVRTKKR